MKLRISETPFIRFGSYSVSCSSEITLRLLSETVTASITYIEYIRNNRNHGAIFSRTFLENRKNFSERRDEIERTFREFLGDEAVVEEIIINYYRRNHADFVLKTSTLKSTTSVSTECRLIHVGI